MREFSLLNLGPFSQKLCLVNRPINCPFTNHFSSVHTRKYTHQRSTWFSSL